MKQASSDGTGVLASHVLAHGLVDCAPWTSVHEGPYTRAAKLAVLNALGASDLCRTLFGKRLIQGRAVGLHGRSLLAGAWMQYGRSTHPLGGVIASQALDQLCGPWAAWIASDEQFRYCPRCLDEGFQSIVYQIDGIERCPLHGQSLLDACARCSAATPSYAITAESLNSPLHCPQCGSPYSPTWTASGKITCWTPPADSRPLAAIHFWLRRLSSANIEWPELSVWQLDPCSQTPKKDVRKAVFDALIGLLPLRFPHKSDSSAVMLCIRQCRTPDGPNHGGDQRHGVMDARVAIYKAIRRYIERCLRPYRYFRDIERRELIQVDWSCEAVIASDALTDARVHGWLLWRHRFEEGFLTSFLNGHSRRNDSFPGSPRLRLIAQSWPVNWSVDAGSWGHFVLRCFHEDIEAAHRWHETTVPLHSPYQRAVTDRTWNVDATRTLYMEQLSIWRHRLSPRMDAWPASLTQFMWRTGAGDERYLVLVGPDRHDCV